MYSLDICLEKRVCAPTCICTTLTSKTPQNIPHYLFLLHFFLLSPASFLGRGQQIRNSACPEARINTMEKCIRLASYMASDRDVD